ELPLVCCSVSGRCSHHRIAVPRKFDRMDKRYHCREHGQDDTRRHEHGCARATPAQLLVQPIGPVGGTGLTAARPARTRIQREKRELILEAALEVFSMHGFRGATIDQIAEAAGMSKPNLLYYFR